MSGALAALTHLRDVVRRYPSALLGYSGGVDSALVAVVMGQELGPDRMAAAIGRSPSVPLAQLEQARTLAQRFSVPLIELDTHELDNPFYVANAPDRCFFCKAELWARLRELAAARGFAVVCDGTHADDRASGEHRPGYAAGERAGVQSPLLEAGLTKDMVRTVARAIGLPNWNAPAAPCLASRVRYGLAITPRRLRQVEEAEAYLREQGVEGDLRVRHQGDRARVEVEPRWIAWVQARVGQIRDRFTDLGFVEVEVDPRGYRRGSLLEDAARRG
jgi:uncharacterized protein